MSKWKVKKFCDDFFSPDHLEWVAWPEGGWTECQAFPTHAEAIAYADEEARTREVVLPRVDFTIQAAVIDLFDEKGKLTHYAIDNADHIKLIATYLLAHAERMEE